ncbi:hypothetical protein ACOME3_007668 [Neoechinorhynchus agilis]
MAGTTRRVVYRRRLSYNTRSNRRKVVRTPGGRLVVHYVKKPGTAPLCGQCKETRLSGIKPSRPKDRRRLKRNKRTVSRPYGGSRCFQCVRDNIIRAFIYQEIQFMSRQAKA